MAKHVALAVALAGAGLFGLWVAGCSDPAKDAKSGDAKKQMKAFSELAKQGDQKAIEAISEGVKDPNPEVAVEAVRNLGSIRRPAAVTALKKVATADQRDVVRQEAVAQLGKVGGREAMGVLRQAARVDPDPRVRETAAYGFAIHRSFEDVPLLVEIAETEQDPVVQTRAVRAIEMILGMTFKYDPGAPLAVRKEALARIHLQAATLAAEQQASLRAMRQRKGR
jgi:HEAT repeat protein